MKAVTLKYAPSIHLFFFQENVQSSDQKLVETLLSFKTPVLILDNKLIFTVSNSKILLVFSNEPVKRILYIAVQSYDTVSKKMSEIRLDSTSSSVPSKFIIVDYFSLINPHPKGDPFLIATWNMLYTIFDRFIERILINTFDPLELNKIIKVKNLTNLHFYAVNDEFILFYTVFPLSKIVRLQIEEKKIISLELSTPGTQGFDQRQVEQILALNFHYLKKMILSTVKILREDDPQTLYQLIKQYNQLEQLIVNVLFNYYDDYGISTEERDFNKYYFDFSIIEDMTKLQVLGISMSIWMREINNITTNVLGKINNIPSNVKLRYLILSGVELPVMNEWDVNCLYYEKEHLTQLSNLDFLPDQLTELQLEYFCAYLNPHEYYIFTQ